MIRFESGRFYIDYFRHDCPEWTAAERNIVMGCIHRLRDQLPIVKLNVQLARSRSANERFENQRLWLQRLDQLWQMLHQMEADIRGSVNTIRFRKLDLGTEVAARAEGMPVTWILTLNINSAPGMNFFRQRADTQVATVFHELTHFYGSEDSGRDLNNAHRLESLLAGPERVASFLRLARYRTREGLQ